MCSASASRVDGAIPPGPHLIAVKHQSMYETLEIVRLSKLPVIVMKKELGRHSALRLHDPALWRHCSRASAGAKALRDDGRGGQGGDRIGPPGNHLPGRDAGSAGRDAAAALGLRRLYRALGLPVVPVAVDSGRLWGRGFIKRGGIVTFKVGDTIPPGLKRDEIEARVHAAINALESLLRRAPSFSAAATIRFETSPICFVGEALVDRLERHLEGQRQAVSRFEPVEQAHAGDRRLVARR